MAPIVHTVVPKPGDVHEAGMNIAEIVDFTDTYLPSKPRKPYQA